MPTTTAANFWLGASLAAFGITVPGSEFLAGLFLAVSCAFLVMGFTPPDDRRSYWLTLGAALICAVLAVHLHRDILENWSLHFLMAMAGALSRYLVEGLLSCGRGFRDAAGTIAPRLLNRWLGKD